MKKMNRKMDDKHKKYIGRYEDKAVNGVLDYMSITSKVNAKFGTNYSVYQVAGYLGRRIQIIEG
jgi:hypothetical protein